MSDRYLRVILTVIAIELAWIGLKDVLPTPVTAQQAVTPVMIRGFEPTPGRPPYIPVAIAGQLSSRAAGLDDIRVRVEPGTTAVKVDMSGAINARIVEPVKIDTSRPLDVKSVPATGTARPGL